MIKAAVEKSKKERNHHNIEPTASIHRAEQTEDIGHKVKSEQSRAGGSEAKGKRTQKNFIMTNTWATGTGDKLKSSTHLFREKTTRGQAASAVSVCLKPKARTQKKRDSTIKKPKKRKRSICSIFQKTHKNRTRRRKEVTQSTNQKPRTQKTDSTQKP